MEYGGYSVKPLSFWGVLGLLVAMMVVELIGYLVIIPFEGILSESSLVYLILSEVISKSLVIWMLIRYYREKENQLVLSEIVEDAFMPEEEKNQPEMKEIVTKRRMFIGAIILAVIGFRFFYDNSFSYVLAENIEIDEALVEAFEELFTWPLYAIFSVVIIAPFYEELVFRKFILGGLLKKTSAANAILISAFFFALIHMNWLQGINAFILGIIVGWIYYKTKSIGLAMFGHFVNNFYAVTLGILQEEFLATPVIWANTLLCIIGGLFLIAAKNKFEHLVVENTEWVVE
jgi:membrane protease YdiL (CAAX protease family)